MLLSRQDARLMLAAVYTVQAYDSYLFKAEGDWVTILNYLRTHISRDLKRCSPDSYDERRPMDAVELEILTAIMSRWVTCGQRSAPDAIRYIGKTLGLKDFKFVL